MPTRKQRRREQKLRRHEWEEVLVDAEGNEIPLDEASPETDKPSASPARNGREKRTARETKPRRSEPASRGRVVQPPSWRRVLKRGLLFAPFMFLTVHLLSREGETIAGKLSQTAFLLAVFLPFSYLMDSLTYRLWQRRTGAAEKARGR